MSSIYRSWILFRSTWYPPCRLRERVNIGNHFEDTELYQKKILGMMAFTVEYVSIMGSDAQRLVSCLQTSRVNKYSHVADVALDQKNMFDNIAFNVEYVSIMGSDAQCLVSSLQASRVSRYR